jgi:HEPN domain-containing protein
MSPASFPLAGDREYSDKDWVNAVREYYSALESGLKYALAEVGATYDEGAALEKLAGRATEEGLIPPNYQAFFGFADSIRSPRSRGAFPNPVEIEVGEH